MSYARRQVISTNRTVAIIIVAIFHALLGYAIVSGLAYTAIQKAADELKTFNVEEEPPPPPKEPPPPPPEQVPESPPPIVSPPRIVRTKVAPPTMVQTVREAPPPVVTRTAPPAPPAPPVRPAPPPPVQTVPPRSAVGELQGLFRGDDYPQRAIEQEEQGSVTVRLTIGTNGLVSDCDVTSSSGSRSLDNITCRILQNRASFTPARDSRGNLTTDTVSQRIRWVLEG